MAEGLERLESISRRYSELMESVIEQTRPTVERATRIATDVLDAIQRIDSLRPPNYAELDMEEMFRLFRIARDDGIATAWTTPPHVLSSLLSAETSPNRQAVIVKSRKEIIDECLERLEYRMKVEPGDRSLEHAYEAVDALHRGLDNLAQSHAVVLTDSLIVDVLNRSTVGSSLDDWTEKDSDETPYVDFWMAIMLVPAHRAYSRFFWLRGDPIPENLNRHATSHRAFQAGVYTARNALEAVMLATSVALGVDKMRTADDMHKRNLPGLE
ncbi:MAG: hypothetical protein HKN91_05395 [Acidimicrobiia bacterium]|nr:hypothetical protein [Acidimicrobiia bacterium]